MTRVERSPDLLFAPPALEFERRTDGSILMRSADPLGESARCVGEWLEHWGRTAPEKDFLLERGEDGRWQGVTYGEALARVRRIAAHLLRLDLSAERTVAILSENSVDAGLLALAAMHVGVPAAFVSPAYSLMTRDYTKLEAIIELLEPGLIYAADVRRFGPALTQVRRRWDVPIMTATGSDDPSGLHTLPFSTLLECADEAAVEQAYLGITPDTVAKLLLTSGSTGTPKAVINTHRMLCANQQAIAQVWPFTDRTPPVVVDWLPWSHTFGSNHNFNLILRTGGTLYIDAGRPAPGLIDGTLANLREIAPTVYFNVPRGYDMLVSALRADDHLRRTFFSRMQVIFYAAAALPQHLWAALGELAHATLGEPVALVSAWGSTETAPLATSCHFQAERSGVIGLPVPGCELKLVPSQSKLEVRVKGPHVTPGYWRRPDLTARHFDAEGYYCIGDAVRFVDVESPERGLEFDGRVAEDFKLDSGTWVNVGALRVAAVATLAPIAQDIVIAGADRSEVGFLIFPNTAACRELCDELPGDAAAAAVYSHPAVRRRVAEGLAALARHGGGTSTYATRALLLVEAPSIDAGEITDKGYINQRAVLARRAAQVEQLYSGEASDPLIVRLAAARPRVRP